MKTVKITFKPVRTLSVPFGHFSMLQGLAYSLMSVDEQLALEIHDRNFPNRKAFKFFCFSDLEGRYSIRSKQLVFEDRRQPSVFVRQQRRRELDDRIRQLLMLAPLLVEDDGQPEDAEQEGEHDRPPEEERPTPHFPRDFREFDMLVAFAHAGDVADDRRFAFVSGRVAKHLLRRVVQHLHGGPRRIDFVVVVREHDGSGEHLPEAPARDSAGDQKQRENRRHFASFERDARTKQPQQRIDQHDAQDQPAVRHGGQKMRDHRAGAHDVVVEVAACAHDASQKDSDDDAAY